MSFHKNFLWGAASASYQIEGGAYEDGKGLSIWDTFSHIPGKVYGNQNGDIACDAYHRYEEDLDLMKELDIQVYRFSISWPRILPSGTGEVNPAGLAYYDAIVDGLLARGIVPWITLYHWDLPQALQDRGGWENRETAYAYAEYAGIVAEHFKGRVHTYITINEPQCIVGLGMIYGNHAPGLHLNAEDSFLAWHHVLLAHGLGTRKIRAIIPDAQISCASTGNLCYIARDASGQYPAETPPDLVTATFRTAAGQGDNFFNHQWFLDPICLGHYPDDPDNVWASAAALVSNEDLKIIHEVPDFISLNIYNGHEIVPSSDSETDTHYITAEKYPGYPRNSLKWPVTPEVLYWGPRLIYERYGLPVGISENGQSCNDRIFLDGQVHDPDRIDFLHRYLLEYQKAGEDGVPITAYLHWSFSDNLEWHSGYEDRFGLVYIDYRDQKRIPKDSFRWYREVIRTNGKSL